MREMKTKNVYKERNKFEFHTTIPAGISNFNFKFYVNYEVSHVCCTSAILRSTRNKKRKQKKKTIFTEKNCFFWKIFDSITIANSNF